MNKALLLVIALALPGAVSAEDAAKPAAKNLMSSYRVLPKPGHEKQLEAALAAHAQKYHHGDQAWRIGEIISGPDANMLHIVEGPTNWAGIDGRGDMGDEHMKDYQTNVMPHVEKTTPDVYVEYQPKLSTTALTQYSNKVAIRHIVVKPGHGSDVEDSLKQWKAIAEKSGITLVAYHTVFSGESTYVLVFRFKNGFADIDTMPSPRKAGEELLGANAYHALVRAPSENVANIWDELIEFKPELGSK